MAERLWETEQEMLDHEQELGDGAMVSWDVSKDKALKDILAAPTVDKIVRCTRCEREFGLLGNCSINEVGQAAIEAGWYCEETEGEHQAWWCEECCAKLQALFGGWHGEIEEEVS